MPLQDSASTTRTRNFARLSSNTAARLLVVSVALGALALVAAFVPSAHAATCSVTSSSDNGPGSLREKMGDNTCDTINFSGATGITLASALLVTRTMTIDGIGQTVVISGNDSVRVFSMDSISATVKNLTISHGADALSGGGIIITSSTLYLSNIVLDNNHVTAAGGVGGAILTVGTSTVVITGSTLSNNSSAASSSSGGAIFNQGGNTVYVTNTTFAGNSAPYLGGAIFNYGSVSIEKSTFDNNSTSVSSGLGGAIYIGFGTLSVFNSTFNNNRVSAVLSSGGGAIEQGGGTLNVINSTFSNNRGNTGAAIHVATGTANVINTIMANKQSGSDCGGVLTTNTNNLIEDGTCSPALSGDPSLLPLANNGGTTQTMALAPGSKAINAGDDTTCNSAPVNHSDQRGVYRPTGAHCDIGAYEAPVFLLMPLITR